jgi:hypothetical protein
LKNKFFGFFLLFITRSNVGGDVALFVVVIMDDVVVGGEDASDVLLDDEVFEILLDTVVLVAIMIMAYRSGREER